MKHIISLSGGIGSYITLKRVITKYGANDVIPVFCDTTDEDGDLYNFLLELEKKYKIKIIRISAYKSVFQCQAEDNFIYNSRVARCSMLLKTIPFNKWLKENYKPDECILYMGIDWSEQHRCVAITKNYAPYKVKYPLCQEILYKQEYLQELKEDGFKMPRLYQIGLTHNNCGGCCVKAGIGHWLLLLEKDRNRFLEVENKEFLLQQKIGKPYTHLKRKGQPYSLRQLRLDKERQQSIFDFEEVNDFGACTCFSEE